jgi:hypothetical protein
MKNKTTIKTKKPASKTGAKKKTVKKTAQPVQVKKQTVCGKLSLWLRSKLSWIWK